MNYCSQKLLLNMLDNHCIHCNEQIANGDDQPLSSYDFLYLPIDFKWFPFTLTFIYFLSFILQLCEVRVLWHSSKSKCSRQLSFIYSGSGVVPLLNIFVSENSNKCNVGYGFVNMTSPQAAWRLYKAFHNQHWEVFSSRKICAVTYARVQVLPIFSFKISKAWAILEYVLLCPNCIILWFQKK
jgi:hypothetical protein